MFGYRLVKIDTRIEGDNNRIKLKVAHNKDKGFFIQLTDRNPKSLLSLRLYLSESFFESMINHMKLIHIMHDTPPEEKGLVP